MTLTIAIPCHSRLEDLLLSLGSIVAAANASPPVELLIIDYGGAVDIAAALEAPLQACPLDSPNTLRVVQYRKRKYFHCTHARNLGIRCATGEYVLASSADVELEPNAVAVIRALIDEKGPTWLRPYTERRRHLEPGFIVAKRTELLEAGGFDERFEYYGPDDRDLASRLERRGGRCALYPYEVYRVRPTPSALQANGYRKRISKKRMSDKGRVLYIENVAAGVLIANEGVDWGAL